MLSTPSPEVLESLANLEHNGNFVRVMGWVKESKDVAVQQLAVTTDVTLHRAQGAYGVLDALHNHASTARAVLAKQLSNRSK